MLTGHKCGATIFHVEDFTLIPTEAEMTIETIARICHEANRALCMELGDDSQVPWDEAPDWQRESAIAGVEAIRDGTITAPRDSHIGWSEQKVADGWVYGPVKDPEAKTHPCLVAFEDLPPEQQAKDHLFFGICRALIGADGGRLSS